MIVDLNFDEIDLLIQAIDLKRHNYNLGDSDDAIDILSQVADRMEAICQRTAEPVASAWEHEVKNDKGRGKHWLRMVEVRIFSEVLYIFRVRAEDLFIFENEQLHDPIKDHSIVLGNIEYRTTHPAPAEIHLKALIAIRGIQAWMLDAGLNMNAVKQEWTQKSGGSHE